MKTVYEDFSSGIDRWDLRIDNYAGYEIKDAVLKLWMGPTEALYYSNVEISDGSFIDMPWKYAVFESRIRFEASHYGSSGWGFWNHSMVVDKSYPIWFIYLRGLRGYPLNGFFIQVGRLFKPLYLFKSIRSYYYGLKIFPFLASIKIISHKPVYESFRFDEWHTYRVEWRRRTISFFIDDVEVGNLPNYMVEVKCRADIWLDNAVFNPPDRRDSAYVYRHVTHENRVKTWMEVDWIKVSSLE